MRSKSDTADGAIARIAARQHGVAATKQMVEAGLTRAGIARRVRAGRLHPLHRGVYAVGHRAPSNERVWIAAVLACGEGAVLSHASAAAHWGLLRPAPGAVDVSVPTTAGLRKRRGVRLHRRRALDSAARTSRLGIPVTTPARTITDLEGVLTPHLVRRALRQAELAGYRLRPELSSDRTRSDLERDFLRLCRRYGLPSPEVNVKIGSWTVDFLWCRERIAVETDFYDYHRGRVAFRDDRARDLGLRRRGFAVHRFSEEQIDEEPETVAADLRHALGRAS
jgi:very-short-patch-repair endonuclease